MLKEQGMTRLSSAQRKAALKPGSFGEVLLHAEVWWLCSLFHAGVLVLAAKAWRSSRVLQEPGWELAGRGVSAPRSALPLEQQAQRATPSTRGQRAGRRDPCETQVIQLENKGNLV